MRDGKWKMEDGKGPDSPILGHAAIFGRWARADPSESNHSLLNFEAGGFGGSPTRRDGKWKMEYGKGPDSLLRGYAAIFGR